MASNAPKPVGGITCVGFLAVEYCVPIARLDRIQLLHDLMTLVEAGEVQPQAAQGLLRSPGSRKQI